MSRIYDTPISSISLVRGAPVSFVYKRQRVVVAELLDFWVMTGQWWEG